MGLGLWVRRLFGRPEPRGELVPYYDFDTNRLVHIPASQLRPGVVQARVRGVEGVVWVSPDQLKPGEVKHPPFDESIREYIRQIQAAFAEQRPLSFEEWEDGFRRDGNPAREIALWSHAADVYTALTAGEPSPDRRRDVYRTVVACLTTGPDDVWKVLRPTALTRAEAERVVNTFFGRGDAAAEAEEE